jgi:Nucleotidyl transferase AbiEii toxin, Type IV TA system
MPSPKTYATAGAFRRALEERLKRASLTDQIDPNRLRRQVSFDRLLARLFREESGPWVLKGGYALELRFKAARSTVDIDLTVQRVGMLDRHHTGWFGVRSDCRLRASLTVLRRSQPGGEAVAFGPER